jgi:hypothetical protein
LHLPNQSLFQEKDSPQPAKRWRTVEIRQPLYVTDIESAAGAAIGGGEMEKRLEELRYDIVIPPVAVQCPKYCEPLVVR